MIFIHILQKKKKKKKKKKNKIKLKLLFRAVSVKSLVW